MVAALWAAPPDALWVDVQAQPSDCNLGAAVAAAVAAIYPDATVKLGNDAAGSDLQLDIWAQDGTARIIVSNPAGTVLMRRQLQGERRCGETADAIALVLERYLDGLGWTPQAHVPTRQPVIAHLPMLAPQLPGSGASVWPFRTHAADESAAIAWSVASHLTASTPGKLGAALSVRARGSWSFAAAEIGARAPANDDVMRGADKLGQVRTWSMHSLFGAGACASAVCASAWLGIERIVADARGDGLFQRESVSSNQLVGRFDIGYGVVLSPSWSAWLGLAALIRPSPAQVVVEDATSYHSDPHASAQLSAGLRWTL